MAVTIVPVSQEHLAQVQVLVNTHLSAVVPGWGLPIAFIASRLRSDPDEFVTNPWVVERQTLCAVERGRVVAVAHLARYGAGPEVSDSFRGIIVLSVAARNEAEGAGRFYQRFGWKVLVRQQKGWR